MIVCAACLKTWHFFIINLKKIRFKLKSGSEREVIEYSFKGPKEITGADLNNDLVEIVNPDAYLATINEDAELNFSVIIQKGIGYVPSEEIREEIEDEYIALDAFFTPVKKSSFMRYKTSWLKMTQTTRRSYLR